MKTENILSVQHVSMCFGAREALSEVSFELTPGETTVLLGSNGAGKTTLLRCVLGLCAPQSGLVRVAGRDPLRESRAVRAQIGYVPDQPDVYGWMTARDLFHFLRGQYPTWSDERAEALIERLQAPANARFDSMSRGEAAKVMFAAALAPAPPLLVLDEAFARLAPPEREELLGVFLEQAPFPGGAALIATHDLDVAARVADRVLVLEEGRLCVDRELEELIDSSDSAVGLPERLRALYPAVRKESALR